MPVDCRWMPAPLNPSTTRLTHSEKSKERTLQIPAHWEILSTVLRAAAPRLHCNQRRACVGGQHSCLCQLQQRDDRGARLDGLHRHLFSFHSLIPRPLPSLSTAQLLSFALLSKVMKPSAILLLVQAVALLSAATCHALDFTIPENIVIGKEVTVEWAGTPSLDTSDQSIVLFKDDEALVSLCHGLVSGSGKCTFTLAEDDVKTLERGNSGYHIGLQGENDITLDISKDFGIRSAKGSTGHDGVKHKKKKQKVQQSEKKARKQREKEREEENKDEDDDQEEDDKDKDENEAEVWASTQFAVRKIIQYTSYAVSPKQATKEYELVFFRYYQASHPSSLSDKYAKS